MKCCHWGSEVIYISPIFLLQLKSLGTRDLSRELREQSKGNSEGCLMVRLYFSSNYNNICSHLICNLWESFSIYGTNICSNLRVLQNLPQTNYVKQYPGPNYVFSVTLSFWESHRFVYQFVLWFIENKNNLFLTTFPSFKKNKIIVFTKASKHKYQLKPNIFFWQLWYLWC